MISFNEFKLKDPKLPDVLSPQACSLLVGHFALVHARLFLQYALQHQRLVALDDAGLTLDDLAVEAPGDRPGCDRIRIDITVHVNVVALLDTLKRQGGGAEAKIQLRRVWKEWKVNYGILETKKARKKE